MVDTIEVGICPTCGVLATVEKIKEIFDEEHPHGNILKCPNCDKINIDINWKFINILVDD